VHLPTALPDGTAATRLLAALAPIPRNDFFFWNSNLLLSCESFQRVAPLVAVAVAAWIVLALSRDRGAAVFFAVGTALLVGLFAFVYAGDVRHHGFLFVLFLMAAWMAKSAPASTSIGGRWTGLPESTLSATLGVVLLLHVAAAPIALYYDYRYVFSSGRRAADFLRSHELSRSLLVAEMDYPATAVIGQLDVDTFALSPRTGRAFSFVKWTRDRRRDPSDEETLRYVFELAGDRRRDVTLIMNRPLLPELIDGQRVVRLAELYDSMIEEENFYIYRVAL
jgi:hypothetical protein